MVVDAAKYYRISRNFKRRLDSGDRLAEIVRVLDSVRPSSVRSDYISQVEEFTSQLNTIYGQRNLSAASKLLWISKCPVIILDSRALEALKNDLKKKPKPVSYTSYCDTWLVAYGKKRNEIVSAAEKLESVIEFSFDSSASKPDMKSLVENEWFLHRVFDNYLWHLGDS